MMNMRTKIILFNKPIWVTDGTINSESGIREVVELYGYKAPSNADRYLENEYLNYLCGVSKWQEEGNDIMNDYWLDYSTKTIYHLDDDYIREYMRKARKQMKVNFSIYTINKRLYEKTDGMLGTFISSHRLYDYIKRCGTFIGGKDVQKTKK